MSEVIRRRENYVIVQVLEDYRLENSQDKQAGKEQGIKSWRQDPGESWTRNLKEKRWEIKERRKTAGQGLEPEEFTERIHSTATDSYSIYSTGET